MFIITQNRNVILGPMKWSKRRFEAVILEDTEVECTLDQSNDPEAYVRVDADIEIWPVVGTPDPVFNSKIQRLHGPFYTYGDGVATSSNVVEDLPIDAVKNMLGAVVTANRYKYEVAGIKVPVQGVEVTVETNRDVRNVFMHKLVLMKDDETVQWKFPETWLTLTKAELEAVITAAAAYVQTQFDWEAAKLAEIAAKTTLAELDAVVTAKE